MALETGSPRGLIRCADCGSAYAGDGKTSSEYSYYRCTGVSTSTAVLQNRARVRRCGPKNWTPSAEMLVAGVSVHTAIDEKGKKEATATLRYLFSDRSSYCVPDHSWDDNITVR